MQQNKILDIIINLLNGIKNKNSIVEEVEYETKMTLNGASYLLNQTLRQYNIPKSHYFISERAFELWNKISKDDILKYTYRDKVTKNTNGNVCVDKYKGSEKEPFQKQVILARGDSFIYNDVFTDEHIVTVSDIIKELLKLTTYNYSSITNILDKMYICKMLKSEDRMIKNKSKRSTDYRKVINKDYLSVGIRLKGFDYPQQLDKNNEIVVEDTIKNHSPEPTVTTTQREKVKHSRFGEGEIICIRGDKIKVVFGGLQIKEFSYPQSVNDGTLTIIKNLAIPPKEQGYSNRDSIIKIGESIEAKTHAEFLSKLFKKEYKGYMKSSKKLSDGKLLWMIELGPFETSSGWINQLASKNLITETHIGITFEFGHNTYKRALLDGQPFDASNRVVFDIVKSDVRRKYVFRGVFRLNIEKSSLNENIWDLIMSEYKI